ncbi:MAG TPA: glucokinase [Gaiellaceae bacterium]|nr:glucokinase [Gaiellaceae bacterium]
MILAGDIGGTSTRLALFDGDPAKPTVLETYPSRAHAGLEELVADFTAAHPSSLEAASFGVAGPVRGGRCVDATNLAWEVDAAPLAALLGLERVQLLNDLEANALGIASLRPSDFAALNDGDPDAAGNAAVVSLGTGLGQAGLYWDGRQHRAFATEGGHVDFAPRSERQVELYRWLEPQLGHVSVERVCSGTGLATLYRFAGGAPDTDPAAIAAGADTGDAAAVEAVDLLVEIYGSHAGNVALAMLATGGVYLGGGIAPKILPRLQAGGFIAAFVDKGRFRRLLERIPVTVILNDKTALLGAARAAREGA